MERMLVRGGRPLSGNVRIHGAKNSALPILAATLLCRGRCILADCPDILDVSAAEQILHLLGCRTERTGSCIVTDASEAENAAIPHDVSGKLRASVNFLGALLARFGEGELAMPGGCVLGSRPINFHLEALRQLGVETEETGGVLRFHWPEKHGGTVTLPFPSVGATENVLLAAVSVPEPVFLHGAACEPEVTDLCRFLVSCGAEIVGIGTPELTVRGGKELVGIAYRILPDRMESATYLCMTAACGGEVRLLHTDWHLLRPVLDALRYAGCEISEQPHGILLRSDGALRAMGTLRTSCYPGFPTDAQAPVMAVSLLAEGETVLEETVFPERFRHVPELRKFGGDIVLSGSTASVRGVRSLYGAHAEITDLRGGAGVLIAALAAEGESVLSGTKLLRRGYAELYENLLALGASVELG